MSSKKEEKRFNQYEHPNPNMKSTKTSEDDDEFEDERGEETNPAVLLGQRDAEIRAALLEGAFHLPGNNYVQDLWQFMANSHPLFSICLHHPLHPVSTGMRVAALMGSLIFGLAISNIIYLAFVIDNKKEDMNTSYAKYGVNQTVTGNVMVDQQLTQVNVTPGMIALWTIGGALNALYDNTIWSLAACSCCPENGRFQKLSRYRGYLVVFMLLAIVVVATLAVLIRATIDSNNADANNAQAASEVGGHANYQKGAESYRFLLSFVVEIILSLLVWNPIMAALLFSGVLGCWRLPVLGGRAAEMRRDEQKKERENNQADKKRKSKVGKTDVEEGANLRANSNSRPSHKASTM